FLFCHHDHRDLHSFPHDALPILVLMIASGTCPPEVGRMRVAAVSGSAPGVNTSALPRSVTRPSTKLWRSWSSPAARSSSSVPVRSEEHTSELQSPCNLVCRLLLE